MAIYKASREDGGDFRSSQIVNTLYNFNEIEYSFRHIELILQQDCVQTICKMMDDTKSTVSFKKLCKEYGLTKNNVQLTNKLRKFKDRYNIFEESQELKAVKNLRNDTLSHSGIKLHQERPTIDMVSTCLESLKELLALAFEISLPDQKLDFELHTNAIQSGQKFWNHLTR